MTRAKRRQPTGACIFCGSSDLSREHVWAEWLKKYIEEGVFHSRSNCCALFDVKRRSRDFEGWVLPLNSEMSSTFAWSVKRSGADAARRRPDHADLERHRKNCGCLLGTCPEVRQHRSALADARLCAANRCQRSARSTELSPQRKRLTAWLRLMRCARARLREDGFRQIAAALQVPHKTAALPDARRISAVVAVTDWRSRRASDMLALQPSLRSAAWVSHVGAPEFRRSRNRRACPQGLRLQYARGFILPTY